MTRGVPASRVVRHGSAVTAVRADNPGPLTLTGTQTYVIGSGPLVVVDPGPADEAHLDRVDEVVAGRPVAAVCLTHAHADHAASAGHAAGRWGELRASAATLDRVDGAGRPLGDDEVIEPGEGLRLWAIATPGHSADHLCYLLEPRRILFTGDLVLGEGSTMIVHPEGSVESYLASLARLAALRPSRLLPGHGPPVEDALARLEESRTHRLDPGGVRPAGPRGGRPQHGRNPGCRVRRPPRVSLRGGRPDDTRLPRLPGGQFLVDQSPEIGGEGEIAELREARPAVYPPPRDLAGSPRSPMHGEPQAEVAECMT